MVWFDWSIDNFMVFITKLNFFPVQFFLQLYPLTRYLSFPQNVQQNYGGLHHSA